MILGKRSGWALALALGMATGAAAQDPPKFTAGPLKFQGYVDGYYSFNNNHPASRNNGYDRFFDIQANQFSLNMAGLYMSTDADPIVNRGGAQEICARGSRSPMLSGGSPPDALWRYLAMLPSESESELSSTSNNGPTVFSGV